MTKVTEDNFGELLIESTEEALEIAKTIRRCNYCRKDTQTKEEDCVTCGFSKPNIIESVVKETER